MNEYYHVWQKPDMCGAACVEMYMKYHGITNVSQEDISHKYHVLKDGWGSPPDRILAFYNQFFTDAGINENTTLEELQDHLEAGIPATVLIQDIFPARESSHSNVKERVGLVEDGHYVNVVDVVLGENGYVLIADPSNEERQYDEDGFVQLEKNPLLPFVYQPLYKVDTEVFKSIWYDQLEDGRIARGVTIWFNPQTQFVM